MDWSKAKTILIIAFLITNILLGVFIVSGDMMEDSTLNKKFVKEVINLLEDKNIKVDSEIPLYKPSLTPILVEYESLSSSKINEEFFKGQGNVRTKEDGLTEISYGQEVVEIENNKLLHYKNLKEENKYQDLDENQVREIALKFLKERNFQRDNMNLTSISKREDDYIVRYSRLYEGVYVERAYLNIYIDERGVKSLDRLWLEVKREGDKELFTSSAPKALLSLLDMDGLGGKVIDDISICYYFEPKDHTYMNAPKNAKRGKTIPAWRILFTDGERIIIDNY